MSTEPKLSQDFNKNLFSEIKRNVLFKNIVSITLISFFKVFLSIIDVFGKPKRPERKDSLKSDNK